MPLKKGITDKFIKILNSGDSTSELFQFLTKNYPLYEGRERIVERFLGLTEKFTQVYGSEPENISRSPGRINLIGEHTDYNGCPVLPIAVDRDMIAAFSATADGSIHLKNISEDFPAKSFTASSDIPPFSTGDWGNYAKAAVQAVMRHPASQKINQIKGIKCMFSGTIPIAAGMSSSTSIVVSTAYAFMKANGINIEKEELSEVLKKAEWYVGTQGGGMDQAIEINSAAGHALKIDFNPFGFIKVPLPKGFRTIVINSMVHAPKTEDAMDRYNRRSATCRIITAVLKRKLSVHTGKKLDIKLLGDLKSDKTGIDEDELERLVFSMIDRDGYTLEEIASMTGMMPDEAVSTFWKRKDGTLMPVPHSGFKLRSRLRHIISEWKRVEESVEYFRHAEMSKFGELMYASHDSCAYDYEISCPELDKIIELCREYRAPGARLTGAGFGGCAIAIVDKYKADDFINFLKKHYYESYLKKHRPDIYKKGIYYPDVIFKTKATDGAGILL